MINKKEIDDDTFDILKKIAESGTEEEYIEFLRKVINHEYCIRRS